MKFLDIKSNEFEAALAENLRAFERKPLRAVPRRRSKLICLGESHGAHVFGMTGNVLPGTGSLLLRRSGAVNNDVLIDPGWGTIASARRLNVDLSSVGVILISHCHLDHVGDLHPLLLTISLAQGCPILVANKTSINGGPGQPSILPDYFRNLCREVIVAEPNETIQLKKVNIIPFSTFHRENKDQAGQSLGYILQGSPSGQLAFITDGPLGVLDESVMAQLRQCRAIIINIGTLSTLRDAPSHSKVFDNALCFDGFEQFLRQLASKRNRINQVAVTHLGAELLEVRSSVMRRFLSQSGYPNTLRLLNSVLKNLVTTVLTKEVRTRVLTEGSYLEV